MDQLLRLPCAPDIRDFLGKLPDNLERAYTEIIDRINSQKRRTPEIARRAFLWVMCSRRPLTPAMLANALCHDPLHEEESVDDRLGSPKEGSAVYMCWSHKISRYSNEKSLVKLSRMSGTAFAVVFFSLGQILYNWWTSDININSLDDRAIVAPHCWAEGKLESHEPVSRRVTIHDATPMKCLMGVITPGLF